MNLRFFFCIFVALFSFPARADGFIEWQSANIQLLKGWDYEVGKQERALVTLEYANRWTYGDLFMFIDGTRDDNGDSKAFTEISPRISLSKITGHHFSYGIIKDVLISTTYEKGKRDTRAYLYGGAVDLDIPGFNFFKVNLYQRVNPNIEKETWQVTLVWKRPFSLGKYTFLAEGFADFAGDAGAAYRANQFIVPRLLVDAGNILGMENRKFWFGVEYSYWHNKFGIDGKTESLPQLQAKWVF
jgi:nucleoside-specific outer membrane channel protein Tsx